MTAEIVEGMDNGTPEKKGKAKKEPAPSSHQKSVKAAKPKDSKATPPAVKEQAKDTDKDKGKEKDYNPWTVLRYPHLAEKSMGLVESQNTLTFIVDRRATKRTVAEAVAKGFNVEVRAVRVTVTQKGVKKAYVQLGPKHSAADIATRLGMI